MRFFFGFALGVLIGVYHAEIGTGVTDANKNLSVALNWYVNGEPSPKEKAIQQARMKAALVVANQDGDNEKPSDLTLKAIREISSSHPCIANYILDNVSHSMSNKESKEVFEYFFEGGAESVPKLDLKKGCSP